MEEVGSTYVCSSVTIWMNSLLQTILNHNPLQERDWEREKKRVRETERKEMERLRCDMLCGVVQYCCIVARSN